MKIICEAKENLDLNRIHFYLERKIAFWCLSAVLIFGSIEYLIPEFDNSGYRFGVINLTQKSSIIFLKLLVSYLIGIFKIVNNII